MTAEDASKLMQVRRSVFPQFYTGERVEDSIVTQMIANATWAPSHKLTQPWRFFVFTDEGIKRLATNQSRIYQEVTQRNGTFRQDKFDSLLKKPLLSSHIIMIAMKRDPNKSVPEVEEIGAVFCAVQNMYLTAQAYGVGCYLSTGGITYFEEAKALFGLASDDKIIGFMHVGVPKEQPRPASRKPVAEVSTWVSA